MDKTTILRAFNNHFFELLEDILRILPENVEILTAKKSWEMVKKANPTALIKAWYIFICSRYSDVIDSGDATFFLEKDYSEDLSNASVGQSESILQMIDNIRIPIKNMTEENKQVSMKYIQNLNKLSQLYSPYIN